MNYIIKLIKKIIFSSFLLYGYNLISVSFGVIIPINIITVLILILTDYYGLFAMIMIQILIY